MVLSSGKKTNKKARTSGERKKIREEQACCVAQRGRGTRGTVVATEKEQNIIDKANKENQGGKESARRIGQLKAGMRSTNTNSHRARTKRSALRSRRLKRGRGNRSTRPEGKGEPGPRETALALGGRKR